jgi:hypothetical protein
MRVKKGILILIFIVYASHIWCQKNTKLCYEEVLNKFSCYEQFDSVLEQATKLAIKAYPELENSFIRFRRGDIKTIMAARPIFVDIFKIKSKRRYEIVLSTNDLNNCDQLFCRIEKQALIGILSHEMAHLLTYNNKSSLQLVCYAFKYLFCKKEIERETDLTTIQRGFAKELIEYNLFVRETKLVSEKYLKNREINYLSVNEIKEKGTQ